MKVMAAELATRAQELGVKYFLISFSDMLGTAPGETRADRGD